MSDRPSWFVQRGGQQLGPVTQAELGERARRGELGPMDPVWREGLPGWVPAQTVEGLFPRPAAAGPSPWARIRFHVERAMAWNLRAVSVRPDEEKALIARGVDDPAARNYLAFRRSVLLLVGWLAAASGVFGLAGLGGDTGMNAFGNAVETVRALVLFVLPAAAFLAARSWTRHRRSRRFVVWGWSITFLVPLLLELVPLHWKFDIDTTNAQQELFVRFVGAIKDYVVLMPAVLALVPGVLRACLRVKVLLPESLMPGWFLVGATPLYVFLFLVVFATVNQVASDPFLVAGVLLVTGGPTLYLVNLRLFTRPIAPGADFQKLVLVQRRVRLILEVGVGFLLVWLAVTGHIFGKRIIGLDEESLVRPWSPDLIKFPLEFGGHSLFTMTLVADAIMAMNLSVWQHMKQFMGTPAAKDYDRTMQEVDEAGSTD